MDKPINQITNIKGLEQLKTYLEERTDLNLSILVDKSNNTLLHFSAFKNDLPRMKVFIKHFKEFTQAHHGVGLYTGNNSFSDKLKAWVNSPNKEGYIPLLYACLHGNLQMIQFLEECGSNMQFRTTKNQNALFMSVQHNKMKALIYLIESKHDYKISQTNLAGNTVLHQACQRGHIQMVSYLLTLGANMEATNNEGETPLVVAAKQMKKQVIKLLLIKGADRSVPNKNGETALQISKKNNRDDIVKILDNDYGCWDKFKIKCNKKIVYQPQKSSYLYSIYFILLFHLFFLPVNLLSEFSISEKYVKIIPLMFEGIYELIILVLYFLLLRKQRKRRSQSLMEIEGNFCAQCKRQTNEKMFHCYICQRCIYRYDHHCPWINNCVGSHNVGKFTFFLFVLLVGLLEVAFCSVCLLIDDIEFVRYRKLFDIPDWIHMPLNIVTILFSTILAIGILNLLIAQFRNLCSNETGFERQKKVKQLTKKSDLLTSEASLNESLNQDFDEEAEKKSCRCFCNCMDMLSQRY